MESSQDVYSRHKIIAVTSLKIMKWFGYSHLEETIVQRHDDQLYMFQKSNFKRLRRQNIEDMLLLLIQDNLTNLNLEERYVLNVALRMLTRRIVIQERMEDLQLGVQSYQKKINLKKPDTYRLDLRRMTAYTTYPDTQGIIYKDEMNKKTISRWRYNLTPAESKFKTPMFDHQDKYMMKAQVHVSKSSAISDVQPLPQKKLYHQTVRAIRRRRYNLIPVESKFKNLVLDRQDKYMMKAQVHVSKSSAISDIQALPQRKHYCQIYQMINLTSGVKW
nr:hypothetical protein [Tanacetum cinerariifolium]